jgi:hypothetical protein
MNTSLAMVATHLPVELKLSGYYRGRNPRIGTKREGHGDLAVEAYCRRDANEGASPIRGLKLDNCAGDGVGGPRPAVAPYPRDILESASIALTQ